MPENRMKFGSMGTTLTEVPDELSVYFNITGCPLRCKYCHSREFWKAKKGMELTQEKFVSAIQQFLPGISCVLFLGGEWYPDKLYPLLRLAHRYDLKTALYTGLELEEIPKQLRNVLDYLKVGRYDANLGGLSCKTTNQRMYTLKDGMVQNDITSKFWR